MVVTTPPPPDRGLFSCQITSPHPAQRTNRPAGPPRPTPPATTHVLRALIAGTRRADRSAARAHPDHLQQLRKVSVLAAPIRHPDYPEQPWWLVGCSQGRAEPWYLLTNEPISTAAEARRLLRAYARRWQMEISNPLLYLAGNPWWSAPACLPGGEHWPRLAAITCGSQRGPAPPSQPDVG